MNENKDMTPLIIHIHYTRMIVRMYKYFKTP